jgi:hypothetical protein
VHDWLFVVAVDFFDSVEPTAKPHTVILIVASTPKTFFRRVVGAEATRPVATRPPNEAMVAYQSTTEVWCPVRAVVQGF